MRDITKDIEERIAEVEAEQGRLQRRIDALAEKGDKLRGVLEYELMRSPPQTSIPGLEAQNGHRLSSPISRFVMKALRDGTARSLNELKRRAKDDGIDFGGKNPGRVLHFALVGMRQTKMVRRLETGEWQLAVEANPSSEATVLGHSVD